MTIQSDAVNSLAHSIGNITSTLPHIEPDGNTFLLLCICFASLIGVMLFYGLKKRKAAKLTKLKESLR